MVAWWLPWVTVAVIGVVPYSGLPIALRLPIPPKYPLGETLEPVSDENLARGINSASFIVDTLYFLEQEMGNKRERRESNLKLKSLEKLLKNQNQFPSPNH